jgi:hypothetical protein
MASGMFPIPGAILHLRRKTKRFACAVWCSVMATLPTITGVHRVAFNWRVSTSGPFATNVMHFLAGSMTPSALRTAIDANVTTGMWVGIALGTAVYQLQITPLDGVSATEVFTVSGSKWAGSNTAGEYSPASSFVVSFKTGTRGRRARGRIYLPFPLESQIASGVSSGAVSGAQTAWDNFRAAMNTATAPQVIATYGHSLHKTKTSGGGYTMTPVTWTATSYLVTSTTVESVLGTQRRRQSRLRV